MSGESPDGWATTDIGSLFSVNTPGHWGEDGESEGNILVLRSANFVKSGGLSYETAALRKFDEKKLAQKLLRPGDILLERSGGSPAQPVGRVNRFDAEGSFSASNFLQILRAREEVDDWFAYYLLDAFYAGGGTENLQKATTGIRNLDFATYSATPILLPPLDEQRRIAEVLRSVDETITSSEQAADQAKLALASTRSHLTGQDGSERDWTLQPLIDCFQLQRGHDLPVQNRTAGSVPVIASNGPVGFHDHAPIPAPAVITGRSGTIGKVSYLDGLCWPLNTTLFVRDFKGSNPRFVYHFLSAFPLAQHATGTGVPTLNRNDVHAVKVLWPERGEQDVRAEILDSVEVTLLAARAALEESRTLKMTLADDLLSGRVRVPA